MLTLKRVLAGECWTLSGSGLVIYTRPGGGATGLPPAISLKPFRFPHDSGLRNTTEVISRRRPGMDHLRLEEATSQLK